MLQRHYFPGLTFFGVAPELPLLLPLFVLLLGLTVLGFVVVPVGWAELPLLPEVVIL